MMLDTDKLYLLLNDKWLEVGLLWRSAFRRQIGLDGSPARRTTHGHAERNLWDEYLREMNIVHPAVEVHFLGRETEHYFVENPSGKGGSRDIWKLGIPKELAMKAIILGYFPDSPSLERLRNS
jgi:hypothetical protein